MTAMGKTGIDCLPEELLELIAEVVWPGDLVSFVLVQHKFHRVSGKRLLDHREKSRHYQYIMVSEEPLRYFDGGVLHYTHPVKLLHAIYQDPFAASYVRLLVNDASSFCRSNEGADQSSVDFKIETDRDLARQCDFFVDIIRNDPVLSKNAELQEQFIDGAESGNFEIYLLLILLLTHNLSRLVLFQGLPARPLLEYALSINSEVFAKLKKIYLHQTYNQYRELSDVQQWVNLPAVETIVARRFQGDGLLPAPSATKCFGSLRNIELIGCHIDGEDLAGLLHGLSGLKSFSYEHDGYYDDDTVWYWSTYDFLDALEDCAGDSLETLQLYFSKTPADDIITLRDFEVSTCLKGPGCRAMPQQVNTDWALFYKKLREYRGNLEMLPHKIVEDTADQKTMHLDLAGCFPTGSINTIALSVRYNNSERIEQVALGNVVLCTKLERIEIPNVTFTPECEQLLEQRSVNAVSGYWTTPSDIYTESIPPFGDRIPYQFSVWW